MKIELEIITDDDFAKDLTSKIAVFAFAEKKLTSGFTLKEVEGYPLSILEVEESNISFNVDDCVEVKYASGRKVLKFFSKIGTGRYLFEENENSMLETEDKPIYLAKNSIHCPKSSQLYFYEPINGCSNYHLFKAEVDDSIEEIIVSTISMSHIGTYHTLEVGPDTKFKSLTISHKIDHVMTGR